jgi:hypothetical protein
MSRVGMLRMLDECRPSGRAEARAVNDQKLTIATMMVAGGASRTQTQFAS